LKKLIKTCKYFVILIAPFISACTSPKLILDKDKIPFEKLLDFVNQEQNKIQTLQATCRISVDSEEFSGHFFADVYYTTNDSLLLSVSGPFGMQAGTLFIGKDRFIFYNQMSNKFFNGTTVDFEQTNFFQFPLNLKELINVFSGKENLPSMKIDTYNIKDNFYYIEAIHSHHQYFLWIDHISGRIKKITMEEQGKVIFSREYANFVEIDGIYFPRQIEMIRPEQNQAVSLFYITLKLNDKIDRENFIVNIADHAEQIFLSR
jgi:hypothetical protein